MSSVPHTDRAGVITANVLLVVRKALLAWLNGDDLDFTFVRAEIADLARRISRRDTASHYRDSAR